MIDIFVEEFDEAMYKVYFVQLGCIYVCPRNVDNLKILCENIVRLYSERNIDESTGEVHYEYLSLSTYHKFYNMHTEELFREKNGEINSYIVKKVS